MQPAGKLFRTIVMGVTAAMLAGSAVSAGDAEAQFYHAYYLDKSQGDAAGAMKLYAAALNNGLGGDLKGEAKARMASCREDIATEDFARIMPPEPLAYAELNRPGERIRRLVDKLGLLHRNAVSPGKHLDRVALSPAVIDAALGMRGMAVAITGFDPQTETPSGVLVFHPGDMELIRGIIETALPVACERTDSIGGYPTYLIEDEAYVTLTARLVIVSNIPNEIEDVIYRLSDPDMESLAGNKRLAELWADHEDALLHFFVNPKPLMPILQPLLAAAATQSHEAAIARALLDPSSLHSISGTFDISDAGLQTEFVLRLDEGHKNLAYNFLRGAAIDKQTLACVPQDAAGVLALALNNAPERYGKTEGDDEPIVTFLDIGREIFANINGIAVYALPPHGAPEGEIPDVAASFTVNEPAKSEALWTQMLGIASLASGAGTLQGDTTRIGNTDVRSYRIADGPTMYVAITGHHVLVGTTRSAMERSLAALGGGKSIMDDQAYADSLARLGNHATLAILASPARCAELAKPHLSPRELAEMTPVTDLLTDTVVALLVTHSGQKLSLSASVTGVPDVGDLVTKLVHEERRRANTGQKARPIEIIVDEPAPPAPIEAFDDQAACAPTVPATSEPTSRPAAPARIYR